MTGSFQEIDPTTAYRDLTFPPPPTGRPYVVANMVSTADGKAVLDGSAAGIGSRTDARLMRQVRAHADAIIWGAGTLQADLVDPRVDVESARSRVERGVPPQPLAVTVTGMLRLEPTNRFFVNGPGDTIVFTTRHAPSERRQAVAPYACVIVHDGPNVDLYEASRHLRDQRNVGLLLAEGGPTLNQRLLDNGLLDELFWTISPKLAGGHGRGLLDGEDVAARIRARMDLVSLYEHDGELYTRYRLPRGADGAYLTP